MFKKEAKTKIRRFGVLLPNSKEKHVSTILLPALHINRTSHLTFYISLFEFWFQFCHSENHVFFSFNLHLDHLRQTRKTFSLSISLLVGVNSNHSLWSKSIFVCFCSVRKRIKKHSRTRIIPLSRSKAWDLLFFSITYSSLLTLLTFLGEMLVKVSVHRPTK